MPLGIIQNPRTEIAKRNLKFYAEASSLPPNSKRCRKCLVVKLKTEFVPCGVKRKYRDGLYSWCRVCRQAYQRGWRHKPGPMRERYLQRRRDGRRRKKYGMMPGQFEAMIAKQKNRCLLCGEKFSSKFSPARVDHCHKTGRVRGILHSNCNTLIGHAKERVSVLEAAIRYLQDHCQIRRPNDNKHL